MTVLGILFSVFTGGLLIALPRAWCPLPFLIGVLWVPRTQLVEIASLKFPLVRILIVIGAIRVVLRSDTVKGRLVPLDWLMLVWCVWLLSSGLFHDEGVAMWRFGDAFTNLGIYLLFRVYLQDSRDIRNTFAIICVVLLPIAAGMAWEKVTGSNVLAGLFGEDSTAVLRHGHFRARGPYANAILAGTNGAICLGFAMNIWRERPRIALLGLAAASIIVLSSGSSGPVMTAFATIGGMALWRVRAYLRPIRWLAVALIVFLDIIMNDPVYFLAARIDISGGSTGWYRAALIQSSFRHIGEWWLVGTDATSHWMPAGTSGIVEHADVTNHYIQMGVWGGLVLMAIFIWFVLAGFSAVGAALRQARMEPLEAQYLIWTLGAILFSHAVTFWSVSYFDPSIILLFYMVMASIATVPSLAISDQESDSLAIAPAEIAGTV